MKTMSRIVCAVLATLLICLEVVPAQKNRSLRKVGRNKSRIIRSAPPQPETAAFGRPSRRPPKPKPSFASQLVSNPTPIAIPSTGTASPYPSSVSIAGLAGSVTDLNVTIHNFSHTFPNDVGIVLVGPTGTSLLLQDGAGDDPDMVNVTYTFTDFGLSQLPDSVAWGPGGYKPTNYITPPDSFPPPGPDTFYNNPGPADEGAATLFSVFGGTNPNGNWHLYVVDFSEGDAGEIAGGWTLEVFTDAAPAAVGDLLISEFRLTGPAGTSNEFIELYNNTDSGLTVGATDGSSGYAVATASNSTLNDGSPTIRFVIPNGTVIPPRGHFLAVNSTISGTAPVPRGAGVSADITYFGDIPENDGIAIFNTSNPAVFSLPTRLDAVGSASMVNTLYKEGTGYAPIGAGSIDYSFYRDECGKGGSIPTFGPCPSAGAVVDTDNNASDFIFVDTNGTSAGAGQRLGAPGAQGLASPIQRNLLITPSLVDPCLSGSAAPNRVRDFTSDPANNSTFGTLDIRRTFLNNTGSDMTQLRFRVIDITTFPAPAGIADLRPRTSSDTSANVSLEGCASGTTTITVNGTILDQPPSQPNGGGFNSTLSAGTITLGTPLPDGATISVRFLLGIQQTGSFKFFINIEALP